MLAAGCNFREYIRRCIDGGFLGEGVAHIFEDIFNAGFLAFQEYFLQDGLKCDVGWMEGCMQKIMRGCIYLVLFIFYLATSGLSDDNGLYFAKIYCVFCIGPLIFIVANYEVYLKEVEQSKLWRLLALMLGAFLLLLFVILIEANIRGVKLPNMS